MAAVAPTALSSLAATAHFSGSTKVEVSSRTAVRPVQLSTRRMVVRATDKKDVDDTLVERIAAGARDIAGKVEDIATGRGTDPAKGEVRAVTNASKSGGPAEDAKKAVEDATEAVVGAVNNVVNVAGGNQGYDASTQKGAFTTPQREALKGRYDPAKTGDRPPQKTVDLDNPMDKQ